MNTRYKDNSLYNFKTSKSLLRFVLAPIILAALIIMLLFTQIGVLVSNHEDIADAEDIILLSMQGKSYALQLQSSVRGYLVAGTEDYLNPYKKALSLFDKNLDQLEDKLLNFDIKCTQCDSVLETKKKWLVLCNDLIEKRHKSSKLLPSGEELDVASEKMNVVISFFDGVVTAQNERLKKIRDNAENNIRYSAALIVIFSIIISTLFGYSTFLYMRKLEEDALNIINDLENTKSELQKSNDELENRVLARTEELNATNAELEAFCYSVSHDLRAPLRGIDGFSLALNEEYGQSIDDVGKKYLNYIRIGVQKMSRIIDDLLKLSRVTRQSVEIGPVDLSDLVHEVVDDTIKESPHKNYDLDKACFVIQENVQTMADERLLRVALENLMSNAWKFSRNKSDQKIVFGVTQKDGKKFFYIQDNGAGFDMNYVQKLFNPFQRLHTESEFEGTGIGLATVQRIVLKHGGDIWAESKPNAGSTFYFTLSERTLDV